MSALFASLRWRLWWSYALVVAVVLGIVAGGLALYLLRNPLATRQTYQRLGEISALLGRGAVVEELPAGRLLAAVERIDQLFDVRAAVVEASGRVAADSRAAAEGPLPSLAWPRRAGNPEVASAFRDRQGKTWLYVMRPLEGGSALMLAAPRPVTPLRALLRDEFLRPFVRAGLAALLLALFLAFWMARWVSAPLQRLAQAARAVAAGRYQPVPEEGPDEFHQVGRAFNEMVARVQASQQSQRDFVANISHELKTPLTSIQGFAQAILDGTAETPEERQRAAGVIHSEAGRMHRLAQDLLELASLDSGAAGLRRAPVDLVAVLGEVIERFAPAAARGQVEIRAELQALPALHGDCDRLAQVFTNLLDNAVKYTPPGGQIVVQAAPLDGQVEISVSDSGPGIPAGELGRVFERFYQVEKSRRGGEGRGAGLGLAIAREIVQAHRGEIFARNNPGPGCSFVVRLPAAAGEQPSSARRERQAPPPERAGA